MAYTEEQKKAIRQYERERKAHKRKSIFSDILIYLAICLFFWYGHFMVDIENQEFKSITYLPTAIEESINCLVEGN